MSKEMPVVILCGGRGTRMGTETDALPKPMLPIGDKPILWHIMRIYSYWGFNNFILALGYKGEVIKDYFLRYREHNSNVEVKLGTGSVRYLDATEVPDWTIKLVDTGLNTLKGGRIKRIEKYVSTDRFMLTYGDGLANIEIPKLLAFHEKHKKLGTLTGVNPPSRFGEIMVEGDRVISFSEKPQTSQGLINGGFFVFESELFDYLTPDEKCDFEKGPLEELASQGKLMVYLHKGMWECMDTPRDMEHLNKLWAEGKAFWKLW
ncbi:MAG: glucose-1-phosphate cytidylyltransferase [Thermoplasmata archaeon]